MTRDRQSAAYHRITSIILRDESDVALSRQRARRIAALAGLSLPDQARFATAAAEISRNAVRHGGGGTVEYGVEAIGRRAFVHATISDSGSGIPELQDILAGVATNAGGGILSARKLVDDFTIESTETGTSVRLSKAAPGSSPRLEAEMIPSWTLLLEQDTSENAWAERRQQTEDLSHTLSELRRKEIDLKRQLKEIRRLNQKLDVLSLVASKTDNGVIITDKDGLIEWVNDGFIRITGFEAMEVYGKKPGHFLQGPETDPETVQRIREKLKTRQSFTEEILNYHKNGRPYWVSMNIFPVLNDRGQVTRFIAIQNDVTRHRQSEHELERAKETAETANRAKSEFLANISHEIRTPMNAIIGMTELALDTQLTGEQRELLETVRGSSRGLLRLLSDLLDLSKIEAGKLDLEIAPFQLRHELEEALRALRERAKRKKLDVSLEVAEDVDETLVGDAGRLRQVIVNLFENAIRFTHTGSIAVRVDREKHEGPERLLHFRVADTGIGIAESQTRRIFQAFHQVDSSTKRRYGGAGLGLSISQQLVQAMGGKLWVESEPDQGSTFHFTAPFQTHDSGAAAKGEKPAEPSEKGGGKQNAAALRALHVLLAEDIDANRQLVTRILGRRGHRVTVAADGRAALQLARAHAFDVILMDIQMPGMDGFEATRAIRDTEDVGRRVPIVAMTAHAMKGDEERCLAAGMDDYLAKPIEAAKLVATVEALANGEPDGMNEANEQVAAPIADGFNFSSAIARMDGDIEIFRELAVLFRSDSKKLLAKIHDAINANEVKSLERAAHSLKGLASNFDAEQAVSAARRLEEMGRKKQIEDGAEAYEAAARETARLDEALRAYLDSA